MQSSEKSSEQKPKTIFQHFLAATRMGDTWRSNIRGVITLLILGALIALGTFIWAQSILTLASFMPVYVAAMTGVAVAGLFSFLFASEIQQCILQAAPAMNEFECNKGTLDLDDMFDKVLEKLNKKDGTEDSAPKWFSKHMPHCRLGVFKQGINPKIITVMGVNNTRSAIFIPSCLGTKKNMTHKEIEALLFVEVSKIKHYSLFAGLIIKCSLSLEGILVGLASSEKILLKALGSTLVPLQFLFLFQRAVSRDSYFSAYKQAVLHGYGPALIRANKIFSSRGESEKPAVRKPLKRPVYEGKMGIRMNKIGLKSLGEKLDSKLKFCADKIDEHELKAWPKAAQGQSRLYSLIGLLFMETSRVLGEAFSDTPSTKSLKEFIEEEMAKLPQKEENNIVPGQKDEPSAKGPYIFSAPLKKNQAPRIKARGQQPDAARFAHLDCILRLRPLSIYPPF